jgi:glyoxylase-like metal-dependent hydrolase (beta-lactamase superfamily II)
VAWLPFPSLHGDFIMTSALDPVLQRACDQVERAFADPRQQPVVHAFFEPVSCTVSYVIRDPGSQACAVIDSVLNFDPAAARASTSTAHELVRFIEQEKLDVKWVLETHVHADHLCAAPYVQRRCGGKTAIGEHVVDTQRYFGHMLNLMTDPHADNPPFDRLFVDGDAFRIGNLEATVLHVPGHMAACLAYVIGDVVFPGDTLFMPDYGTARCDFPGGDARQLYRSIRRLLSLPDPTRLYFCHDYLPAGRTEYVWETTVGVQKRENIHVRQEISEDDFVHMRESRDRTLAMPRLLFFAVQVNMRGGRLPSAESNGMHYLKVPINPV